MTAIEYLKLMRRNLRSKRSIDRYGSMSDYEVILHYFAAHGDGIGANFQEIDLPVMEVLEEAKPKISPEDQRSITLEYTTLPEGETDLEEGAIIFDKKRTRLSQYKMFSSLYIDFGFWNVVKADSKFITREEGQKVRDALREEFENEASWERLKQKLIVHKEYHRRLREKDKEYPGDKEELIRALKKYIGNIEIPGKTFDVEAAWEIAGKKVEEKEKEFAELEKELEDLPDIPGDELDADASYQKFVQRMKEVEERKTKLNSDDAEQED